MATIVRDASYTVYADVGTADIYLEAATHAATWRAASDDDKERALITATRILDRQLWATGYTTFADRAVVANIVDASCEMALALIDGSDLQNEQVSEQEIASMSAGAVSLSYFRSAGGAAYRFSVIITELLRGYLESSSDASSMAGVVGMIATGVGGSSSTEDDFGHTGGM